MDAMGDDVVNDWINQLPDEILVDIINRLSVVEAARTSVLSTRWKYLWTFITSLDFHSPRGMWKVLNKLDENEQSIKWTWGAVYRRYDREILVKRAKYICWVNKVLELHRGSSIDELKVSYELYDSHERIITSWIRAAISKGVQKLELNLRAAWGNRQYTFPKELSSISSLKSLSLSGVNVTSEIIESLVYNCPLLERLCVANSRPWLCLKVVISSIRLKHLVIEGCFSNEEFEISTPSLLSFKYHGTGHIKLNVQNVPQLVDLYISGYNLSNMIRPFINYLTQLETLELHFYLCEDNTRSPLCELPKLRYLTLSVSAPGAGNLFVLTHMIRACPFLLKFTLKFQLVGPRTERAIKQFPKCAHEHLKVVEFIGFVGHSIDLELAFYLLKNSISLEKMIIDLTSPFSRGNYWDFEDCEEKKEEKKAARMRARKLKEKAPKGVKLVIY
ncbi:FBD-associated F-box protein [Melia azedarach]|uniref:FBD-associated F-box protein n=1 Tax=Melia azedarach TaxID=155640 RepID=A0ACC1XPY8_MELAZ|nr:FBD-associated F-box protein [Melia azedarach]